jgi:hypothetical protein
LPDSEISAQRAIVAQPPGNALLFRFTYRRSRATKAKNESNYGLMLLTGITLPVREKSED